MKFLIVLCMCAGLSVAQQGLPNYFQGSFNVPNAPIPAPGASGYGGAPAAPSPAAWAGQPQAAAYSAAPRPQWAAPAAPAQYSPAAPAYARAVQAAPAAAPVASVPSQYGWNVQHSIPQAPQPVPQAAAPAPQQWAPAPQPQYSPAQYAQAQQAAAPAYQAPAQSYQAPAQSYQAPAQAYPSQAAPASPVSTALLRPASVHYANIGESLNGDYKFGYKTGNGDSFREESRTPDGTVMGQYGFTDADGKQRIVKYSAGVQGFQVLNDGQSSPAPAAAAPAAPQWGQPAAAPQQQWGQPAAAPQQQWG